MKTQLTIIGIIISIHTSVAQQVNHLTISEMKSTEMTKGITLRTASGLNGTFGEFTMKKDAFVPMHSHANEQYSFIMKGSVQATIGDTVMIIKAGQVVIIPPNVPHSFKSLEEGTIDFDFFAPRREDWLNGTADYFKK